MRHNMNVTVGIKLATPKLSINAQGGVTRTTIENVPFTPESAMSKDAVSVRIVCKPEDATAAKAKLLSAKAKLQYEGEVKSGTFQDGSVWLTLGRRGSTSNASALDEFLKA